MKIGLGTRYGRYMSCSHCPKRSQQWLSHNVVKWVSSTNNAIIAVICVLEWLLPATVLVNGDWCYNLQVWPMSCIRVELKTGVWTIIIWVLGGNIAGQVKASRGYFIAWITYLQDFWIIIKYTYVRKLSHRMHARYKQFLLALNGTMNGTSMFWSCEIILTSFMLGISLNLLIDCHYRWMKHN